MEVSQPQPQSQPVRMTKSIGIELWRQSLEQEIGLSVGCEPEDCEHVKTMLYKWRQEESDPRLMDIMLCSPPGKKEIWFVKKMVELPF
jgi:hypothetical protein